MQLNNSKKMETKINALTFFEFATLLQGYIVYKRGSKTPQRMYNYQLFWGKHKIHDILSSNGFITQNRPNN